MAKKMAANIRSGTSMTATAHFVTIRAAVDNLLSRLSALATF
jgi:hypothetical protein